MTSQSRDGIALDEATITVVAAIIHRDMDILLVHEQGPGDGMSKWSLPGGRAEAGESLEEALRREVREETGLVVEEIGGLVNYCTLADDATSYTTAVYKVDAWSGELAPADPDGLIIEARFVIPAEAILLVQQRPEAPRKEPVIAYLRGEISEPESWIYRRAADDGWEFDWREALPHG